MIESHKKLISLFVAIAFIFLMHITTVPLQSASPSKAPSAGSTLSSDDETPGAIEQRSPAYRSKKKSSILPIIIGVVAVGAVAAVLVLVVFKTKYDITGQWRLFDTLTSDFSTIFFTGNKKSGAVSFSGYTDTGTYTVDGKNVTFQYADPPPPNNDYLFAHTGKFDSKDEMSGEIVYTNGNDRRVGTWYAERSTETAATPSGLVKIPKTKKESIR